MFNAQILERFTNEVNTETLIAQKHPQLIVQNKFLVLNPKLDNSITYSIHGFILVISPSLSKDYQWHAPDIAKARQWHYFFSSWTHFDTFSFQEKDYQWHPREIAIWTT